MYCVLAADHHLLVILQSELDEIRLDVVGIAAAAGEQSENQVKRGQVLDVVVSKREAILQLLPAEDETLFIRVNAFRVSIRAN